MFLRSAILGDSAMFHRCISSLSFATLISITPAFIMGTLHSTASRAIVESEVSPDLCETTGVMLFFTARDTVSYA